MLCLNPFHPIGLFLYHLKTSENQRFSEVFRGYRKRPMGWNGLRIGYEGIFRLYRNQSIDLHCESIDWFLCNGKEPLVTNKHLKSYLHHQFSKIFNSNSFFPETFFSVVRWCLFLGNIYVHS